MDNQFTLLKDAFKAALVEFHKEHDQATLTPEQAAEVLQLNVGKVYELCRRPGFPALQDGRKWIIHKEAMLNWIVEEAERQKEAKRQNMQRLFLESKLG